MCTQRDAVWGYLLCLLPCRLDSDQPDNAVTSWNACLWDYLSIPSFQYLLVLLLFPISDVTRFHWTENKGLWWHQKCCCTVHLKHLRRAFPKPTRTCAYFEQCPHSFDTNKLRKFKYNINTEEAGTLCVMAETFQSFTVSKLQPNADNPNLSVCISLTGIDNSASKECRAITLDLLLHAGVLVESETGNVIWCRIISYDVYT